MAKITTSLWIHASIEECFDCARSIDIHMESTARTRERAIGGRTSGLIELEECVTWEAVHFGIRQQLTARITEFEPPIRFVDEMVSGAFKRFWHEHRFIPKDGGTLMVDTFDYSAPWGILGRCAEGLFLTRYMTRFLEERNQYIKLAAERRHLAL